MIAFDQYVMGLAASNTPCFGYHERGNATCGECPLAERCVESRSLRAVAVAAQLVKAAKAAKAAKAIPMESARTLMPPSGDSEFEIEALFGDVLKPEAPPPVVPPAPPVQAAPAPQPRVTVMKAVIDSVCFVCNCKVPAKSEAAFIPGMGLRHMTCV
jgi:hypothetical protein